MFWDCGLSLTHARWAFGCLILASVCATVSTGSNDIVLAVDLCVGVLACTALELS